MWEGVVNERAAGFWQGLGNGRLAQVYWQSAYDCFARWGATAKLHEMETQYRKWLAADIPSPSNRDDLSVMQARDSLLEKQVQLLRSQAIRAVDLRMQKQLERVAGELVPATEHLRAEIAERKSVEEALRVHQAQILESREIAEAANRELRRANEIIERLARSDSLTGLANRREFDETLRREIARAQRLGGSLSMIIGDLDHFKSVNDEFGHVIGDRVLIGVAGIFARQTRPYDLSTRFGGEEFVLLFSGSTLDAAIALAERLRQEVSEVKIDGCPKQITMSCGVANWRSGEIPEVFISRADRALYQAKRDGRNLVASA